MENLRRLGGEAGVVAGIATAWLFVGLVFIFPSAGLQLADQANPHRYLPFVARHAEMFWTINILGGLAAALLSAVTFLAISDRFRDDAPASARIGSVAGVMGAAAFAAAALVRHISFGSLSSVYAANGASAAYAFYAVSAIVNSLAGLGHVAVGLGMLVFGNVMFRHRRYNNVGYLSVVAGTATVMAGLVINAFTFALGTVSMTAWLIWTALVMRSEAGPAWFRWGAAKVRANGRVQRRAA